MIIKVLEQQQEPKATCPSTVMAGFDDLSDDEDLVMVMDSADHLAYLQEVIAEKEACLDTIQRLMRDEGECPKSSLNYSQIS